MIAPGYTYRAAILRVIDGDTLEARVDVGFRIWAELPLRLAGINAPEKDTAAGQEAKAYVQQWCAAHPLTVIATQKNPEKYGRWLAIVTAPSDADVSLNAALVREGHALAWNGQGKAPVA